MSKSIIRDKLAKQEFIVAPGIHDMMTALLASEIGFEIVYASGYWLTASGYGLPDVGIATYTQMLDRVSTVARTSNAAVIADADTGYGGLLNVHHTVRGYEEANIPAIHIEDQEFPKKCGHTPGKRCVSKEEMIDKVKVACDARRNPDTLIIARTDAYHVEGFDNAIERGEAYGEAGADIVFVEALTSEEEMRLACREISKPMMVNMSDGGLTPSRTADELEDMGYALAIFPDITALAANHAVMKALTLLKEQGTSNDPSVPLYDFNKFCKLIGFEDVWAFDKKWARDK